MSTLLRCYPGDRSLDYLLVVTLGVALASCAAWLISRRLEGKAALRRLVLFSALVCCLVSPAVAWFCAAAGLTVVSIPVFCGESAKTAAGVTQIRAEPAETPPEQSTDPPPAATGVPSPQSNTTIEQIADAAVVCFACSAEQSIAKSVSSEPDAQPAGDPEATPLSFRGIATGAMFVWATGALLMLARLAWNCGRVVHLRRSSRRVQNERLQTLLQEVAGQLGARQVPLLLVSSSTVTPLAVGFGRPAVILPARLLGVVSDNELRDVLIHEVAHLQRGDQRIVLLEELAGALYWPIVSVHGLNRELRWAREELCDNVVLASRNAIRYGETLLHVAELVVKARPMGAAVGILGRQGELERRITGLIDPRRSTMTRIGRKTACVVIFMFIALGAFASTTRFAASAGATETSEGTVAEVAPPKPQEADAAPRDIPSDLDDPKRAGHFSGRVTDPDGQPVRGARIFIAPYKKRYSWKINEIGPVRAKTDADGRFKFDAPDMVLTDLDGLPTRRRGLVIATADGYGPDWIETRGRTRSSRIRRPVNGTDLELQLATDDVPIRGRFLDPDGRPLAGALVSLTRLIIPKQRDLNTYIDYVTRDNSALMNGPDYERSLYRPILLPGLILETRTDADGRFTLAGLGRERLAGLKVSAPSVVDTTVTVMTRDAPRIGTYRFNGKPTQSTYGANFTLQLKRGRTISGRVIDHDSREPIPGMWVGIGRKDYPRDGVIWEQQEQEVTDANGRFKITGVDPKLFDQDDLIGSRGVVVVSPPGLPYLSASAAMERDAEVLIESPRGISFRLKLVDEHGRPVEAEISYVEVLPNPHAPRAFVYPSHKPISRAARTADGTYRGFVVPGPGAVLVKTPDRQGYRPAYVDPKTFFAPGRTDWTEKERIWSYGDQEKVMTSWGAAFQDDYAAIILVNPLPDSGPLELSATVMPDTPRRVSLVDPDGKPVVGVETQGLTRHSDSEPPLRAASFPLDQTPS